MCHLHIYTLSLLFNNMTAPRVSPEDWQLLCSENLCHVPVSSALLGTFSFLLKGFSLCMSVSIQVCVYGVCMMCMTFSSLSLFYFCQHVEMHSQHAEHGALTRTWHTRSVSSVTRRIIGYVVLSCAWQRCYVIYMLYYLLCAICCADGIVFFSSLADVYCHFVTAFSVKN